MQLEDALFGWVRGRPTITQYIGSGPGPIGTRFFKLKIPQGSKFPAMVQQGAGLQTQQLACGVDGTVRITLQIDHYARSWAEMAALGTAFRRALEREQTYPVQMGEGDSPDDSVRVKSAKIENQFDLDDPEPGLFRRSQTWSFWIWER
jgi:hypothetical protein